MILGLATLMAPGKAAPVTGLIRLGALAAVLLALKN
jgi:hypothetical protein